MPSQGTPTLGHIVAAVDTSCSVTKKQLQEIYSEINSMRNMYKPKRMTVIGCDSKIQTILELQEYDDIAKVKLGGGGGTKFAPVMAWAKKEKPMLLMYFTDLEAEHYEKSDEPGFNTLWICYSKHKPQGIGKTIYYNPEHRP